MQFEIQNKSRSLLGVTDLTLAAPVKRGLIPALDSRSYESRLRLLLRTLNTLRVSSLEAEPTPLIADAVDRIRAIHSFRLAIVGEDQRQLVLAVAFDGGWEPYMRRIWRDLGPLLDVIFCNCEGYLISRGHDFADYAAWVRRSQLGTEFFYNASSLTVSDLHYLRDQERRRRDGEDVPPPVGNAVEQAMPALNALYRLTDLYPPAAAGLDSLRQQDDGACLLRAARYLLQDVADQLDATDPNARRAPAERAALLWFSSGGEQPQDKRASPGATWDPSRAQGGIAEPYDGIAHACLLLVELADEQAAAALLGHERSGVIRARERATGSAALPFVNVGFTAQGLKVAGVPAGTLEQLPFEFREGMAARASALGDLCHNHPTRWTLPERNWPEPARDPHARVELTCVHAIVQVACRGPLSLAWQDFAGNDRHPLRAFVQRFDEDLRSAGVRILSVQAMQRFAEGPGTTPRGHFGFLDGISQPSLDPASGKHGPWDGYKVGDLFLGYENSLGDPGMRGRLWDDSTFLVVRKLSQDVAALDDAIARNPGVDAKLAKAKMMGRGLDGENLVDGSAGNDFDFAKDVDGSKCPLQSHIRRANPRALRPDLMAVPRIVRRGMSYGPRKVEPGKPAERGVVFMAYCASIAEQFEVIQAWLSGGNSAGDGSYSALRDPFIGVPQPGDPHTFVYRDDAGRAVRLDLKSDRPFVKLEWGVYLFVPSVRALAELNEIASEAPSEKAASKPSADKALDKREKARERERAVQAQKGAALIGRLQLLERMQGPEAARTQWKIALEDVSARLSGASQFIWTAIREQYGGALRTPYGVLVGSRALVTEVFDNRGDAYYSVRGYADRMAQSFGEIYLGMDRRDYERSVAGKVNDAIMAVTEREAFESAASVTAEVVRRLAPAGGETTVEVRDLVDEVLAGFSTEWFGIPDGRHVVPGGWHWRGRSELPTCPGHFHSPSRYMFQPNPGTEAAEAGQLHGQALHAKVQAFVTAHRSAGTTPAAPLGQALFAAIPGSGSDAQGLLASTLIGVMMGFLPTVDGNVRGLLYEWMSDRSLWDHEGAFLAAEGDAYARAERALRAPLRRTLQLRPVPEVVWRIALKEHRLGTVTVEEGETVVVGIVSAMQEARLDDVDDVYPVFGGNRREKQHPLHACPGYAMAMGIMLGIVAGLMDAARLRPTMSPFALRMTRR